MAGFFSKVLEWVRWIFGVVPKSAFGSPRFFLAVHYTGLFLVFLLLCIFSDPVRKNILGITTPMELPPWLDRIWCGPMFLLMYAIVRVVLYLIYLLGIEDDVEFPDIDSAWNTALQDLQAQGLEIDNLPLFLVNGLTPQQEKNAFTAAADVQWRVTSPQAGGTANPVLRVYGRDDAIYVCCSGIGTTSLQLGKVATDPVGPPPGQRGNQAPAVPGNAARTRKAGDVPAARALPQSPSATRQAGVPGGNTVIPAELKPAPAPRPPGIGGIFGTMAPGALRRAMQTVKSLNDAGGKGVGKKRLSPLNSMESQLGVRRMQFLCRLILKARKPYIGINGMLQAVPFSWAASTQYAGSLVPSVKDDLITVHNTLQLQFPVVFAVTELDSISGLREFLKRADTIDEYLRLSRAGSSFAAGAELSEPNSQWIVDRAVSWFRDWVYTAFSRELDSRENPRMFQMLCEISQRREGLVKLLTESLYRVLPSTIRLHGVYFAATGERNTEQGFVRGVIDKLPELQSAVAWSPEVLVGLQRSKLFAGVLYVLAVVMMLSAVLLVATVNRGVSGL
jgi:type IV secretory pathway VirB3-like protein